MQNSSYVILLTNVFIDFTVIYTQIPPPSSMMTGVCYSKGEDKTWTGWWWMAVSAQGFKSFWGLISLNKRSRNRRLFFSKDWRKKFSLSHYYWESCFTSSSPSSCSCFSSPNSFRKNAFYALKSISCSSCKYFTFGKGSNLAMKPQHILDRRNGQWHFSVMSFELQFHVRK